MAEQKENKPDRESGFSGWDNESVTDVPPGRLNLIGANSNDYIVHGHSLYNEP